MSLVKFFGTVSLLVVLIACCNAVLDLSSSANCFSLNFYKKMVSGKDNVISSPFSVDVAMSMLLAGAGGSTADELKTSLGFGNNKFSDIADAFKTNLDKLNTGNGNNTLSIANSVWIQKHFDVKQDFKQSVENNFNAEERSEDFIQNAHKATGDINSWVNNKTRGLIQKLFDTDLDPSTIMVLINAIYFKGVWAYKFDKSKSKQELFFNENAPNVRVTLMHQRAQFNYKYNNVLKVEILEMDYVGGDISMQIILPPNGTKMASLENSLTCSTFSNVISSAGSTLVDVTMPKFDVSSDFNLNNNLMDIGIKKIFEGSANLTGISNGISVSKVVQKAVVKVYEEGSEAAAVTGVVITKSNSIGGPKNEVVYFRADHPFMFLIRHKPTNLVLFMGRIKSLSG